MHIDDKNYFEKVLYKMLLDDPLKIIIKHTNEMILIEIYLQKQVEKDDKK